MVFVLIITFMIRLVIILITLLLLAVLWLLYIAIITICTVVALIILAISFKATSREQEEVGANLAGVWGSGGGQKAVLGVEALRGFWGLGFRA